MRGCNIWLRGKYLPITKSGFALKTKNPLAVAGKGAKLNFRSNIDVVWDWKSLVMRVHIANLHQRMQIFGNIPKSLVITKVNQIP
jgi:hypothetical protein